MSKRGVEADLVGLSAAVAESHRQVHSTFANRAADERAWRLAAAQAHQDVAAFEEQLVSTEGRLREDDSRAIDQALAFLEADPWTFRSGYAKERLLRRLGHVTLSADQQRRSVRVVESWTEGRPRREFRQLTRFARRFDSVVHPWALGQLSAVDPVTRRHALWLVFALPGPVSTESTTAAVRDALVDACSGDPEMWRRSEWLRQAVRQVWTPEWGRQLMERALGTNELGLGELRLLGYTKVPRLAPEEQQRLHDAIVREVRTETLDLPFENLACWIPDDSLLAAAEELRQDSDAGVALRAWWVVRAIRLARGEVPAF